MDNTQIRNVLITDEIDKNCIHILKQGGIDVCVETKLAPADLLKKIQDFDALIVRSSTKVTKDVIQAAKKLKLIGRAGTGVDNIDLKAATEAGILVMNTPAGNCRSVAELTCASILNLSRRIPQADSTLKQGKWDRKSFMGIEVYDRTLAIIGLGRIGREVALRMKPFGTKLIGFDPLVSVEESRTFGVEWVSLDEIWQRADFITLHVPLIPQTENLVNTKTLEKCKKGVFIINNSRGGIINESDLLEALENGRCGGAVIDSFVQEPPTDFTLAKHKNVIATPHIGASTVEAQLRVAEEIADQIVAYSEGQKMIGNVNGHALAALFDSEISEIIACASDAAKLLKNLGRFQNFKTVTMSVPDFVRKYDAALHAAVSLGFVKNSVESKANLINANLLAANLGLQTKIETDMTSKERKIDLIGQLQSGEKVQISVGRSSIGSILMSVNGCKFSDLVSLNGLVAIYETDGKNFGGLIQYLSDKASSICCAEMKENNNQNGRIVAVKIKNENLIKESATGSNGFKLLTFCSF